MRPGWFVVLLVLAACGQVSTLTDAGPDATADAGFTLDAGADGGFEVLPPDIAWLDAGMPAIALPSLTPCPDGWREVPAEEGGEVDEATPATCAPYPEAGPEACVDGWAHFPGEGACTPVGAACPAGDFPAGLPPERAVVYVLSSAAIGGDGSEAAPLVRIADAMALAAPGTLIALGKGVYDEAVRLSAGVTLWGACAEETRLTVSSPGVLDRAVVAVAAADTQVHNLRLGPADLPGLTVSGAGASVVVDGLLIEGTQGSGIVTTDGARVVGQTLSVSGTRADSAGENGQGISLGTAGAVELSRVVLSGNRESGVFAHDPGTSLTLSDITIRDTESRPSDGERGLALSVRLGAMAEVSRALLVRNRDFGVYADGDGTALTLSDVVIRDTESRQSDGTRGRGLAVQFGATADISRAVFQRNRDLAMIFAHEGTSVTLSDIVVRDTQGRQSDGANGRGLGVESSAVVQVVRGSFAGNRHLGVYAEGEGTSLTLTDLVVRDTASQESDGTLGRGLSVLFGAEVEVNRALFARNHEIGVAAAHPGTSVTLSDVVVRGTESQESDGRFGRGLDVQFASATVVRALFEHNAETGAIAMGAGASMTLSDVVVRDTEGRRSDRWHGRGMGVQFGATATVTRALFARNHETGIYVQGEGTTVMLLDVSVRDTEAQESDGAGGRGLNVQGGAAVDVTRAHFAHNRDVGVIMTGEGTAATLSDIVIRDTRGRQSDDKYGRGLGVETGASVVVNHGLFERNHDYGVAAMSPGTMVRLADTVIADTAEQVCAQSTCTEQPSGMGLATVRSARLTVSDFVIRNSALCGVIIGSQGQIDLLRGQVSGSLVGVCLQVDDYDSSRLTDGVRYTDNGTNLDATDLPLPELAGAASPVM